MLARDHAGMSRQIFLTKSPVLAERVEENFKKLKASLDVADLSAQELVSHTKESDQPQVHGLVSTRDRIDFRLDLPTKFGDLQDKHFPLFITIDKVRLFMTCSGRYSNTYSSPVSSSCKCWKQRHLCPEENSRRTKNSRETHGLNFPRMSRSAWVDMTSYYV
jgi:hypothetical protein